MTGDRPQPSAASKPVILVADDDPSVLLALETDVRDRFASEFAVVGVGSGPEATETTDALRLRGDEVALFLVDQRMPDVTGLDVLRHGRLVFPDAKRVLITAYADTSVAIDGINEVGLDHYVVKPWHPPEAALYPVLEDLLDEWRATRPATTDGVQVLGLRWSALTADLKDFLALNQIPYRFFDAERDADAQPLLAALGPDPKLPVAVLPDGTSLTRPDPRDIAERIGLHTASSHDLYDLVVVGAGPSGLAAAVYGASEGLRTAVVERRAVGGQAGTSSRIENYLGFPKGISGADLARRAEAQALRFGAEIIRVTEVTGIEVDGSMRVVRLGDGTGLRTRSVVIASGMTTRMLDVPGFDRLRGRGIHYGATMADGVAHAGERVAVVGGANSAGQAAMMFSRRSECVHLIVRASDLEARMSSYLVDQVSDTPSIQVLLETEVVEAVGDGHVEALVTKNGATGESATHPVSGVFIFVGAIPHTSFLDGTVVLNERGFVLTGPELTSRGALPADWPLERPPYLLETSIPGVFAVGDVREGSVRRVAAAVGSGSASLTFIHAYLDTV